MGVFIVDFKEQKLLDERVALNLVHNVDVESIFDFIEDANHVPCRN